MPRNEREELNLCDSDCNNCPIILHPNSRMVTRILNLLHTKHPDIYKTVQDYCPNLTVCPDCRIDDFTHVESCKLREAKPEIFVRDLIDNAPDLLHYDYKWRDSENYMDIDVALRLLG